MTTRDEMDALAASMTAQSKQLRPTEEPTMTVYVIREVHGTDYYSETYGWVPASDRATEYETREDAEAVVARECQARTVKVFARDVE
jgi:hypothetical protein